MWIRELKVSNFRCFEHAKVKFNNKINIIYGNNASGKTSLIEAICCLGITKSFRCVDQKEIINENSDYSVAEGLVVRNDSSEKILFSLTDAGKKIKLNNYQYKKVSDFLGYFNVVWFSALDFLFMKGSSKERRKLVDLIICQISKDYIEMSNNYKKLLKERNTLLKRLYFENRTNLQTLLNVITNQLIDVGKKIMLIRKEFVDKISFFASEEHSKITEGKELLKVEYTPSVNAENYEEEMLKNLGEDLKKGYTTIGPHRDDCIFIINNKNTMNFGSQGQQRNALLSVKLGMAKLLYNTKKDAPVLLLDDVFSELDKNRQNAIIKCLNPAFQTIITAASVTDLSSEIVEKANLIDIENIEKRRV